ncbi:MAG TPA: PaaI family thioesterase [Methylibium sp.]|uniref:PaaI family thioesterase n=1 Tax=Methylibium sp. TaxID=2067992 RepID=UPI002DBE407A|nr:PaaI family thioesterase [Methylibium sp.]HEU4457556.1 PaaI family thioesterase [Methylibium sp.]
MNRRLNDTEAQAQLERWQADEARVRAQMLSKGQQAGFRRPHEVAHLSGIELFEAMFRGELPFAPIGETLDFLPVHIEPGVAIFQGRPQQRHYNPMGTVHGGWYATLLDSCVACAIHAALPAGRAYTTVELKINLVRALTDKTPLVRAEGRLIHLGRSMGTADGRLVGHDGTLYAHASTTCFILEVPGARGGPGGPAA